MARATQVGEVLTVHRLDSEPLRKGLIADEALLRQSAGKMQANFEGMTGAMTNVNAKAVTVQQTFGVLGAQAGAMGGAFGAATSSALSFGGALSGIGKAAFGLPGLILLVAAGVGVLVNAFVKQAAAAKMAREEFAAYTKTLKDEAATASTALTGMQQKLELAGAARAGPGAALRTQAAIDEENLAARANVQFRRRNELQAKLIEMQTKLVGGDLPAHERREADLRTAIELTERTEETIRSLILERRQKLADDLVTMTEGRLKREAEAEKRAADERGRILAATPMGRVLGAIQGELKAALERQQTGAIFGRIQGLLPEGLRKSIEAKLGLTTPEAAEIPGRPSGRVAFAAGGFTDIAAAGGQLGGGMQDIERRKERRDEKRTNDLGELLALVRVILTSRRRDVMQA